MMLCCLGLLFQTQVYAQWLKINNLPPQEMVAMAIKDDTLYVASGGNKLYKTGDAGDTWETKTISTQPIEVSTITIIDNHIYVGTFSHGIFVSNNAGYTWTGYANHLPAISGFVKFNNQIFAGTIGYGVYTFDAIKNDWIPFNNQLPSNWAYGVETIATTPNHLLIGAGANGVFFTYDFTGNQWVSHYYYGVLKPGIAFNKMIADGDTLYAVDGRRIIKSIDGGLNWVDDKTGSRNGVDKTIYAGKHTCYTLTNLIDGEFWIQKRRKDAPIGATWATDETFLSIGYAYGMIEYKNKLFLATENGLYVNQLSSGITQPVDAAKATVQLYPNPSIGGNTHLNSTLPTKQVSINNLLGKTVYTTEGIGQEAALTPNLNPGIYWVTIYLQNNQQLTQKIVVE